MKVIFFNAGYVINFQNYLLNVSIVIKVIVILENHI